MCGIVGYFGGAGNNLTRVLTAMSAIAYRAPDSTGIGLFGDDVEPIRLRKSLGAVTQLVEALMGNNLYPCPETTLLTLSKSNGDQTDPIEQQRRLLAFEDLPMAFYQQVSQGRADYINFDELVDLHADAPKRLSPGWPGRPETNSVFFIRSKKDLLELIRRMIREYDLSPLVVQVIIRQSLCETIASPASGQLPEIELEDILAAFDQLFEKVLLGGQGSKPGRLDYGWFPKNPYAQKYLWRHLIQTPVKIPSDYDRDGVRCIFRLLDAAMLSRLPHDPVLSEKLQEILENLWPEARHPDLIDWRKLYGMEKGCNVFGWAAAAALTYLQREEFLPGILDKLPDKHLMTSDAFVAGHTDPVSLRYLSSPILSHGRWALQSPITVKNAHPFCDAMRQRVVVLNGQFDSRVEESLHEFLKSVGNLSFRSENSTEYLSLIWGYYYDLLDREKQRGDKILSQVDAGFEKYNISSESIDYGIYHKLKGKTPAEIDKAAFIAAVKQIVRDGGQIAVAGMSLVSPRRLYVASHNRPVFVVHRLDNDDFMVVSDINAAMGLFPQGLIQDEILALARLKRDYDADTAKLKAAAASTGAIRERQSNYQKDMAGLLEAFRVAVYPLDGEEIFAEIGTFLKPDGLHRKVTITDFEGDPLHDIEAFVTTLNPQDRARRDLDKSFHETHLEEIPERLREILRFYQAEEGALPEFNIHKKLFRQRFGKDFSRLKRMVLIGTGSSRHMGLIVKDFIRRLMPDMDLLVLHPGESDELSRTIDIGKDLVVLLSWSSTTADMVRTAKRLQELKAVMVGITEKVFADMALIASKSGGVIPVLSGEEVTVSAVKSTICMLFCLELFCLWIADHKGREEEALASLKEVVRLPEVISQLLQDEAIRRFSKDLASKYSHSICTVVIDALNAGGEGREIALKLEENTWSAIGKTMDYKDGLACGVKDNLDRALILVNATRRDLIDDALQVMENLHHSGVAFVAVSIPNRKQAVIEKYSRQQCILLPRLTESLQPFVDLFFYYQFAFDYGLAHGRVIGAPPRNRAKSVTVSRTLTQKIHSPAMALSFLKDRPGLPETETETDSAITRESLWEKKAIDNQERKYYRQMRRLAGHLKTGDLLASRLQFDPEAIARLSSALFEDVSDIEEIVFVPLDRAGESVARNAGDLWRLLLDYPARVAFPEENLAPFGEGTLSIILGARQPDRKSYETLLASVNSPFMSVGVKIPELLNPKAIGSFSFDSGHPALNGDLLYAALNLILIRSWQAVFPHKAEILEKHFKDSAEVILSILNASDLWQDILASVSQNQGYRSAFFIAPPTGNRISWVDRFDCHGRLVMEQHQYGESAHGPIVTVDPKVEQKFVRLEPRERMISTYGDEAVSDWERRYVGGKSIDELSSRLSTGVAFGYQKPFFAEENWYLPELRPDYETINDNLIIMDATSEPYLPQALDELAIYGCRYPRMIVISQETFLTPSVEKAFSRYPVSRLVLLPQIQIDEGRYPISDYLLPFAMNLVGMNMAFASWRCKK
jgi:glucosamine 6-phosphate synthetase-like amidotransferase/phosphosugar isomerase protein